MGFARLGEGGWARKKKRQMVHEFLRFRHTAFANKPAGKFSMGNWYYMVATAAKAGYIGPGGSMQPHILIHGRCEEEWCRVAQRSGKKRDRVVVDADAELADRRCRAGRDEQHGGHRQLGGER